MYLFFRGILDDSTDDTSMDDDGDDSEDCDDVYHQLSSTNLDNRSWCGTITEEELSAISEEDSLSSYDGLYITNRSNLNRSNKNYNSGRSEPHRAGSYSTKSDFEINDTNIIVSPPTPEPETKTAPATPEPTAPEPEVKASAPASAISPTSNGRPTAFPEAVGFLRPAGHLDKIGRSQTTTTRNDNSTSQIADQYACKSFNSDETTGGIKSFDDNCVSVAQGSHNHLSRYKRASLDLSPFLDGMKTKVPSQQFSSSSRTHQLSCEILTKINDLQKSIKNGQKQLCDLVHDERQEPHVPSARQASNVSGQEFLFGEEMRQAYATYEGKYFI